MWGPGGLPHKGWACVMRDRLPPNSCPQGPRTGSLQSWSLVRNEVRMITDLCLRGCGQGRGRSGDGGCTPAWSSAPLGEQGGPSLKGFLCLGAALDLQPRKPSASRQTWPPQTPDTRGAEAAHPIKAKARDGGKGRGIGAQGLECVLQGQDSGRRWALMPLLCSTQILSWEEPGREPTGRQHRHGWGQRAGL